MKAKLSMKFEHKDKLDIFLTRIDQYLTDGTNQVEITFSSKHVAPWDGEELAEENDQFLSDVSGNANVYMLYTAEKGSSSYQLRYVGKTTRKLARQRLRNHLFKKSDGTGAKLDSIKAHVQSGGSVKISWVSIEPESLRNWAEEELIFSHPEANWNRENA
jgi:hypothetical protein